MLNELFVSNSGESLFLELLSDYLQVTSRGFVKLLKVREATRDLLKLPTLPFLVGPSGEILTGEINLAEHLAKLGGVYDILFGRTQEAQFKQIDFIRYFKETHSNKESVLKFLNDHLLSNTFCNGYHITISDLYTFAQTILIVQSFSDDDKVNYCNIIRWVDHIQSLKGIKEKIKELRLRVLLPYEPLFLEANVVEAKPGKIEAKKQQSKIEFLNILEQSEPKGLEKQASEKKEEVVMPNKPEKSDISNKGEPKTETTNESKKHEVNQQKTEEVKTDAKAKKAEQPKKEQKQAASKNAKKQEDDSHPISKLDIRVGKVVSIHVNEKSEKLYNEEIDIGNGEIRKIASGLKGRVNIEDLKDSLVVVLTNLKARTLCEWPSHGMILCASDESGKIEPIRPPAGSKPGDAVFIGDFPRLPVPELNPKKNPWEQVSAEVFVNSDKNATYQGTSIWKTDNGNIGTTVLTGGKIS